MNSSNEVLSQIVVYNKYAKYRRDLSRREGWEEIVDRYVCMLLKKYCGEEVEIQFKNKSVKVDKGSLAERIINSSKYLYDKRVLPSMRALQFSGVAIEKNHARVYNCSYAPIDDYRSFSEIMFLLLSGCGCGYSVQYHHIEKLPEVYKPTKGRKFLISDSIEGWSDAIKALMKAYFGVSKYRPEFDFSDIREKGEPLITAGGKAPGPEPLKICLAKIESIFKSKENGSKLTDIEVHDIVCHIADSVLAGGIRRAALICLFSMDSKEMLTCKHGNWWELNPQRGRANNSAVIVRNRIKKKEFKSLWKDVENSRSGEPGISFTNDSEYGFNPCHEISLRPYTFCNLCEINAGTVTSQDDLNKRAEVATFFSTLQAGFTNFHYLRPVWRINTEKDSLVGIGMTGICNNKVLSLNLEEAAELVKNVNKDVASLIGINSAARTTTVKPSGCRPSTPDSLVTTEQGIFTLPELFKEHIGDGFSPIKSEYIVSGNGNKLLKTFNNGIEDVYEITLQGQITLKATKNHPWFVKNNYTSKKYEVVNQFIETSELLFGDILDVNLGIYKGTTKELNTINLFPYYMNNVNTDVTFPTHMSEDLAWLLGYMWGDGSMCPVKYRLRFVDQNIDNLQKANKIFTQLFSISGSIVDIDDRDAYSLEVSSKVVFMWFIENGFKKYNSNDISEIPYSVRTSKAEHVLSFFSGLIDSDGCVRILDNYKGFTISQKESIVTRHWQQVALCVGLHMNHSINTQREGANSTNNMVLMSSTGFSLPESMSIIEKNSVKLSKVNLPMQSTENCKPNQILGKVLSVVNIGPMPTYDVEVENEPWFYAGAVKSHNTTSCVLGTSSGIHAWHSEFYIRNMQCAVGDDLYNYFVTYAPELIKVMDYDPKSAVIGIPQKAPKQAIKRSDETAIDFLERVKRFNLEWVRNGHSSGPNYNNVSATVSLKDSEWEDVGEWMWENRNVYSGISVLPYDGGTYADAPFQECTEYEYNKRVHYIKENPIDLTKIVEFVDNTNLSGELACVGGACEISY